MVSEIVIKDAAGRADPAAQRDARRPRPRAGVARLGPAAAIDGEASGAAAGRCRAPTAGPSAGRGDGGAGGRRRRDDAHARAPPERRAGAHARAASACRPRPTPRPVAHRAGPRPSRRRSSTSRPRTAAAAHEGGAGSAREVLPAGGSRAGARRAPRCGRRSCARRSSSEHVPQSLVTTAQAPEPVRILPRGNWLDESGEVVEPAVPHFLPPIETDGRRATRLDLARWLTSAENPLTARVFVNRLWKLFFGHGLVAVARRPRLAGRVADASRAARLARRRVHRERLGREAPGAADRHLGHLPAVLARLARARRARSRQPAARAAGALPARRRDGPRQRPGRQRPARRTGSAARASSPTSREGYWAYLNFPPREWTTDAGEDQYRRGLYTYWQRTFLHPSLVAFDAPRREECTAERTRSNIPQQALVLLNDPTYVEAARVFAERILREGGADLEGRLRWAFERALGRGPARRGSAHPRRPAATSTGRSTAPTRRPRAGSSRRDWRRSATDVDAAELAAWTSVARAILNLHETITQVVSSDGILTDDLRAMRERFTRRAFLGRSATGLGALALAVARSTRSGCWPREPDRWRGRRQPALHFPPRAKRVIYLYHGRRAVAPRDVRLQAEARPRCTASRCPSRSPRASRSPSSRARSCNCFGPQHPFQQLRPVGPGDLRRCFPHIGTHRRRHLHRPLAADRADQPRPGPHVHEHRHARSPAGRSMGSWICYGLGSESDDLPGFVVLTSHRPRRPDAADRRAAVAQRLPAQPLPGRRSSARKGDPVLYLAQPRGRRPPSSSATWSTRSQALNQHARPTASTTPRSPRGSASTRWRSGCRRACRS